MRVKLYLVNDDELMTEQEYQKYIVNLTDDRCIDATEFDGWCAESPYQLAFMSDREREELMADWRAYCTEMAQSEASYSSREFILDI